MEAPATQYVERGDGVSIAYQVFGEGPLDLLYIPGFISHLDLSWTEPRVARFFRRLGAFGRVAMFDKPGTGLSDPILHVPSLEERVDDCLRVMDAAGMEQAAVLGFSEGGMTALLLAASVPERATSVVTYGTVPTGQPSEEMLAVMEMTQADVDAIWSRFDHALDRWGSGASAEIFIPSLRGPAERRFWALFERAAAGPRMARALLEATRHNDITGVVHTVQQPVLLVHRSEDIAPIQVAYWMAGQMPDARVLELPGADHAFWMEESDPIVDEIERFLTGGTRGADPDRVLATVLFSDIAGSTERASALGDARWRELLEQYDVHTRAEVRRHGGRVVKSLGDGHLCLFDGPGRAIRAASALRAAGAEVGLEVRLGVHTGECEVMGDDVGGLAVHIGARVGALAEPGEILVSSTVKELSMGGAFTFAERGEHDLKGVPGRWRVYRALPLGHSEPIAPDRDLRPSDRVALKLAEKAPGAMRGAVTMLRRSRRAAQV